MKVDTVSAIATLIQAGPPDVSYLHVSNSRQQAIESCRDLVQHVDEAVEPALIKIHTMWFVMADRNIRVFFTSVDARMECVVQGLTITSIFWDANEPWLMHAGVLSPYIAASGGTVI
jgi:hypothetical protein